MTTMTATTTNPTTTTTILNFFMKWSFTILTLVYTVILIFVTIKIEIDNRNRNQENNNDFDNDSDDNFLLFSAIVIPTFVVICFRAQEAFRKGEFGRISIELWIAVVLFMVSANALVRDDSNDTFVLMVFFPLIFMGSWSIEGWGHNCVYGAARSNDDGGDNQGYNNFETTVEFVTTHNDDHERNDDTTGIRNNDCDSKKGIMKVRVWS